MKIWNIILLSVLAVLLFFSLFDPKIIINYDNRLNFNIISNINNSTVMVLDPIGSNIYGVECAGVWIKEDMFLTADHCLEGDNIWYQVYQNRDDHVFGSYFDAYAGVVIKRNKDLDLALVFGLGGKHGISKISEKGIIGDKVWVVGHPNEFIYTLIDGTISGKRIIKKEKLEVKLWQINGTIGPGDSGGGVFDTNGDLLGICSFINTKGARFGFYVTGEEVNKFIK